jgi:Ca-activated chloride channel homolog
MRRLLLSLSAVAVLASACSSSAMPASTPVPYDPGHHLPTPPPVARRPAASYGGVTYQDPGSNPWVDPRQDGESTFALDVDTASYSIAQRYVMDGNTPDPASIRVEEWVNAFDQGYPAPEDDTFAVVADGGPTPFLARDEVLLRIGLQARSVSSRQRPPAALTFVIDTSGSMASGERLETVKDALRTLVRALDRRDRVAIVTFGDDARLVLPSTSIVDARAILDAIDALRPGGSTNLEAGLRIGYDVARQTLTEAGIDRVILASDGVANVGLTDAGGILEGIRRDAAAGIELVTVGVGMGNYNDALLEQLADDGDGFYAYVNSREEADRLFRDDLTKTIDTVALDARAQVSFDRRTVEAYRLVGYENRSIRDGAFHDDGIDAGAIGAGHAVTALYALRLNEDVTPIDRVATISVRWTDPERNRPDELIRDIRADAIAESFHATNPYFRFDALVAATAEVLRRSEMVADLDLRDVVRIGNEEARQLPPTDQVHGFLEMLDELAGRN